MKSTHGSCRLDRFVTAPELIDAALADRVLIYGSLPPQGRDLDLLAREPEERAIGKILYLQECGRLGVRVLDGERPEADICAGSHVRSG